MLSRLVLALFLCLPSCLVAQKISITGRGDIKLKEVSFSELTSWANDDHKKALQSFLNSCDKFAKMPQKRVIGGQIGDITAGDFRDVCDIANIVKTMTSAQAKNFFENWFRPFTVETRFGLGSGLFTGYYEASLNGSKVKTEKFQYPIYAKPKDLDLTRAEIEDGVLKGKGLELLYTDDKVALFFMQIQGSGRAKMPDGAEVRLSFAARNNQPFVPVVNYMSKQGYLKKGVSVREWLKANPDKMDAVMNTNPAYTFFKIAESEFVIGGQGVPLTAGRSLAVDSDVIPYGLPIWIDTNLKSRDGVKTPYSRLLIAQDTGSAIKGTIRGDVFFGYGKEAEEAASFMSSHGKYFILLPVNVVDKIR